MDQDETVACAANEEGKTKYRVVKDNFAKIVRDCITKLDVLPDELYSRDLLGDHTHNCLMSNRSEDSHLASGTAIKEVLEKLEKDYACWDKFLCALKDSDLETVAVYLERDLKSRMPGYKGKFSITDTLVSFRNNLIRRGKQLISLNVTGSLNRKTTCMELIYLLNSAE